MEIGKIGLSKDVRLKMMYLDGFNDYFKTSLDEEVTKQVNKLLYEFAQGQDVSLSYICEKFKVGIEYLPQEEEKYVYKLKLIPIF